MKTIKTFQPSNKIGITQKFVSLPTMVWLLIAVIFSNSDLYGQNGPVFMNNSHEMMFDMNPKYSPALVKEKLINARLLSEIIPNYPVNWITSYISVELQTNQNGHLVKGISKNEVLNEEQKNMLKNLKVSDDLLVKVDYTYLDPATKEVQNNHMKVTLCITPDINAHFEGGRDRMKQYLMNNGLSQVSASTPKKNQKGSITFVVSETGEINNARISKTSGDAKTDQVLLNLINKMPKWVPAKDAKGHAARQEFIFSLGNDGC